MDYQLLFNIQIMHSFYSIGYGNDFMLVPDEHTKKLIQNHRIVIRRKGNGINIIVPTNGPSTSDNLIYPLPKDWKFRFFMKLVKQEFFLYTDIDSGTINQILQRKQFYHFDFNDSTSTINGGTKLLKPERTDHFEVYGPNLGPIEDSSQEMEAFFLKSVPIKGLTTSDFSLKGLQPGRINVDEYSEPLKRILVRTYDQMIGTNFTASYRYVPDWPSSTIGLIDVSNHSSFTRGQDYTVNFQAKEETWNYYLVTPTGWQNPEIRLGTRKFPVSEPASDDPIMEDLKERYPPNATLKHLFFDISTRAYSDTPIAGIKLFANGKVVVNNLPNPFPADQGKTILNLFQS